MIVHHGAPRRVLDEAMTRLAAAAPGARVVLVCTGAVLPVASAGWPPDTRVLEAPNRSYAFAVNTGLTELGEASYLAFMNDDVFVEPPTFDVLLAALDSAPGAGLAGPVPLDGTGRPQDLGVPYRLAYARARRSHEGQTEVAWLAGCLIVMTRQAYVATGGLDEEFRFTNEDLDLGLRARRLGYRSLLVDTQVTHLGGSSTPSHPAFHVEGRRGGYLVTARHLPALLRPVHRAYLVVEGAVGSLLAPDATGREGHGRVARMALARDWGTSPFGPSLGDR